jgi:Asp-tRNA(Asn)/Glu-tRNA(Gln) amidotransferase A subunit family amidase
VQLVGRPYEETAIFHAASVLERNAGWYTSPETRPGWFAP